MARIFHLRKQTLDTIFLDHPCLCSIYKDQLARIEQLRDMDLAYADARWSQCVDHLLTDLFLILPENVIGNELRLAQFIRTDSTWRQHGCVALLWRLEIQTITLLAFVLLFSHGLVDLSGLQGNIDFENPEWLTYHVRLALSNFKFTTYLDHPPAMAMCDSYTAPFTWLACMIVRGTCVDRLEPILDVLLDVGIFGGFNEDAFRLSWRAGTILRRRPGAMNPYPAVRLCGKRLGFYLPMGIPDERMHVHEILEVFRRCRHSWEIFVKYFRLEGMCSLQGRLRPKL